MVEKQNIPKGWKEICFSDALEYEQPTKYLVKSTNYQKNGTPVLTAGKSFLLGYTNEKAGLYCRTPVIIFDDFTTDSKYVEFQFKVKSSAIKFLKDKGGNNLKLLYEILYSAKLVSIGGDHKRRWISDFAKRSILLPKDIQEQQKIAEVLTKVDDAITQTEQLIAKYQRIKTGLMQDLLTKGIKPNSVELITSHLKNIKINPKFKQLSFKNITSVKQGFQIAISKREKENGLNRFIYITVQYLNNPKKYLEFIENPPENVICFPEDILFTRTGNTGQIVSGVKGVYHNNFFKISFNKNEITRDYLILYLNWKPVQDLISELAGTTTIPDLKHKEFYNMPIFFPESLKDQIKVTEIVGSATLSIENLKKKLSKLVSLKKGLMQDLLSGKKRVTTLLKK